VKCGAKSVPLLSDVSALQGADACVWREGAACYRQLDGPSVNFLADVQFNYPLLFKRLLYYSTKWEKHGVVAAPGLAGLRPAARQQADRESLDNFMNAANENADYGRLFSLAPIDGHPSAQRDIDLDQLAAAADYLASQGPPGAERLFEVHQLDTGTVVFGLTIPASPRWFAFWSSLWQTPNPDRRRCGCYRSHLGGRPASRRSTQ
jgi:hypothetical protein